MMKQVGMAIALLASFVAGSTLALAAQGAPDSTQQSNSVNQAKWNSQKRRATLPSGIEIAYLDLGNPQGQPLLLLHGYTDSSRAWSLLIPYLGRHRLIVPDQRGHGASSAPPCCYGTSQLAEDARQLLDALKIERAAIAGHSMGSMVAVALAADHPDRVDRIALIGSTALAPVRRGDWLWTNVSELKWPLDPHGKFLREWHPANQPTPVDSAFANAAMNEILAIKPHVWRGVLRELAEVPVARHAADVRAAVLILSGGADPLFPPEHHQALVKAFPSASAHVYPGLGHSPLWEKPAEVGRAIDGFMRQ
ncbi:MAG TPA: alpha/beta hydrolase [Rhizorhapis sp.]|nr:alpha/beta hydrolase [Rhizorhapis sp.]